MKKREPLAQRTFLINSNHYKNTDVKDFDLACGKINQVFRLNF